MGFLLLYCGKSYLACTLKTAVNGGFLGALTTFSSYAMEVVVLWQNAQSLALVYLISSWLANLSAVGLSYWLVKSFI